MTRQALKQLNKTIQVTIKIKVSTILHLIAYAVLIGIILWSHLAHAYPLNSNIAVKPIASANNGHILILPEATNPSKELMSKLTAIQAPQPAPQPEVVQILVQAPIVQTSTDNLPQTSVSGCGDNAEANFIYMHESGCSTTSVNSLGCRGLGQACPGDKLPCGDDYACQNDYFTNYANQRYGGWDGAYAFWIAHSWW